jgi:hypothetical protein
MDDELFPNHHHHHQAQLNTPINGIVMKYEHEWDDELGFFFFEL